MNELTNKEKMDLMTKAIEVVEKRLEGFGYISNLTANELESMVIWEFHELIKEELYKRANSKEEK